VFVCVMVLILKKFKECLQSEPHYQDGDGIEAV
jgi:hypothetical protein